MATVPTEPLPDAGLEHEAEAHDLRPLLLGGLSRSLGWVALLTALGALLGLYLGITQPDLYLSDAKLLLRVGARELASSESMVGSSSEPRNTAPTILDEIQMLTDVAIFEKVARSLGPQLLLQPADPRRYDDAETPGYLRFLHTLQSRYFEGLLADHDCTGDSCATCLRQATKELVKRTTIDSARESNVILVSTVSTSPELAQRILQALADAFIERHREQFSIQSLVEKNRPKVEQAKRDRDAAAIAYVDHINRTGIEAVEPANPSVTELSVLEDKLWDAKLQLAQLREQRKSLTERAENQQGTDSASGPVLMVPNQQYESLLEQKHILITERRAVPAPSPARMQQLDAKIVEIDESLSRLPTAVAKATEFRTRIEPVILSDGEGPPEDEHSLELKIQALTDRYLEKKGKSDTVRRQNLMAEQQRKDLASSRDSAELRYQQIQERFSVLEALSTIDINEDANLRLLQTPTLEVESVEPRRFGLILKGMLAGLLAGSLLAIARQKFDTKLRYPDEFERRHGLPVLGVVPRIAALRRLPKPTAREAS